MAKTQYSFSDDQTLLGAPDDFVVTVRNLKVSAGAGFLVALTGDIMTMPGLPKGPGGGKRSTWTRPARSPDCFKAEHHGTHVSLSLPRPGHRLLCPDRCGTRPGGPPPPSCCWGSWPGLSSPWPGAATNTAVYGISDTWTARTVCALLFPFGLATVVLMGAELFTGNCLITISLLDRRCTLGGMLRNWVLVYAGNTVGRSADRPGLC